MGLLNRLNRGVRAAMAPPPAKRPLTPAQHDYLSALGAKWEARHGAEPIMAAPDGNKPLSAVIDSLTVAAASNAIDWLKAELATPEEPS